MLSGILTRKLAAAVLTAGLIGATSVTGTLALSGPASGTRPCATEAQAARANPSVATLRALGDCEIARRMTTLDKLTAAVSNAKALSGADAAALNTQISSTRSGLTALKVTI